MDPLDWTKDSPLLGLYESSKSTTALHNLGNNEMRQFHGSAADDPEPNIAPWLNIHNQRFRTSADELTKIGTGVALPRCTPLCFASDKHHVGKVLVFYTN